jgi:hypothetical protein
MNKKELAHLGSRFLKELALPTLAAIVYLCFPTIRQSELLTEIGWLIPLSQVGQYVV